MQGFTVISPMSILINFVQKKSQNYVYSVVISLKVKVKVAQSWLTFCNPMDYPWNSLGQNIGVGSLSQLQGIFPTQGSNPGLLHCSGFFTSWDTMEAQEYWSG